MLRFLFILVVLLYSQLGFSQIKHPQTKQEMMAVCVKFMDTFKAGKYTDGIQLLKPYTVIEDYKLDTLANTMSSQMEAVSSVYGKTLSYEQLSEKEVKNTLSKVVYLAKLEKYYLKFVFMLYNNGSGWTIIKFDYSEKIDDLF